MDCRQTELQCISESIKAQQLRHKPFDVAFDSLFVQGMFDKFTEVYGEHDYYYFQSLCTDWGSIEDNNWIDEMYTARFVVMLPHPAHAVLVLAKKVPGIFESANAWAMAKRCGIDPEVIDMKIIIRMMKIFCSREMARDSSRTPFRGKIPLYLFHEKRTAEDWMKFSRVVLFVCAWWGQPEAPHLEGDDMKTATRALAKEEERKSFRKDTLGIDNTLLNKVKIFFNEFDFFGCEETFTKMIRNFVVLVMHYPNLKWRLARILHDAAENAGIEAETIEAHRYKFGISQYVQGWYSESSLLTSKSKDQRITASQWNKIIQTHRNIGERLLKSLLS